MFLLVMLLFPINESHTHINKYLCLHSFDSDYLCCQIYNKAQEWHAIVGVGVIVGVVCGSKCICVYREHRRLDEDLQSGP